MEFIREYSILLLIPLIGYILVVLTKIAVAAYSNIISK